MRIGILTSSRADFGIYLPLINDLKKDNYFKFSLIVFGTHLSKQHGYTLHEIIENGVDPRFVFEPVLVLGGVGVQALLHPLFHVSMMDWK